MTCHSPSILLFLLQPLVSRIVTLKLATSSTRPQVRWLKTIHRREDLVNLFTKARAPSFLSPLPLRTSPVLKRSNLPSCSSRIPRGSSFHQPRQMPFGPLVHSDDCGLLSHIAADRYLPEAQRNPQILWSEKNVTRTPGLSQHHAELRNKGETLFLCGTGISSWPSCVS